MIPVFMGVARLIKRWALHGIDQVDTVCIDGGLSRLLLHINYKYNQLIDPDRHSMHYNMCNQNSSPVS